MHWPTSGIDPITNRVAAGRVLLYRIAQIDIGALPHDSPLTLEIARQTAVRCSREADRYLLVFDPVSRRGGSRTSMFLSFGCHPPTWLLEKNSSFTNEISAESLIFQHRSKSDAEVQASAAASNN